MRKFVGVKSWFEVALNPSLKQDVLLFDQIAIPDYKLLLPFLEKRQEGGEFYVSELEWLRENGLIFEPARDKNNQKVWANEEFRQHYDSEIKELDNHIEFTEQLQTNIEKVQGPNADPKAPIPKPQLIELIQNTFTHIHKVAEHRVRRFSVQLRLSEEADAYPLLESDLYSSEEKESRKADVVQIVFHALPVPDDSTSWERILDFRRDPDSQKKFSNLRHWMKKFAKGQITHAEAQDDVEHLINEYENHIKLHKMKTRAVRIAVVIQAGAAVIEQNLAPLAGGIATYIVARISLLEGESKAPGNEVAYIVTARDRFS